MANGILNILNVADLQRTFAFYKGLGLRTSKASMDMGGTPMSWVNVTSGPQHAMMFFERDFEGADPEDVKWASGEVGKGVLVNVGVPNAKKTHAAAKALGAKPTDLTPNPWGGQSFQVADPDGYYLMLTDKFPAAPRRAKKAAKKSAKAAKKSARRKR